MHEHGFSSLINRPTKITDNSSTLLDQIWTNSNTPQKVKSCIITFSISDHLATMMHIAVNIYKSSKTNSECYHQFSDSKIKSFSKFLSVLDITLVLTKLIQTLHITNFTKTTETKFEEYFPLKRGSTTTDREQCRLAEKGDPKYIFTIPRAILPKPSLCDEITATKSL